MSSQQMGTSGTGVHADSAASASATLASPSGAGVPFTRIINPDVARNSVIVFGFALLVAIVGAFTLFPKAFPTLYTKLMTVVFKKTTPPVRANASLLRARLLFVAALMMIGDAVNNIAMLESADLTGDALFIPFQLLRGITFVPAGPMFVMAMASRIAIIVVMRPKWKTWFVRVVYGIALYVMLQQQIILVIGVSQRLHLDPAGWIDALLFPQWTAGPMALLPLFSIGGSLVALRIAFSQPASSSSGSTSSSGSNSTVPASQASVAPSATSSKPTVQSGATTIKYPLTNAFTTLNVLILLEWIGFIACVANQNPPIPIRVSAILGLILSLGILTEGSFEWLLKQGRKKQQLASAAASSTSSSHGHQPSAIAKSASLSRAPSASKPHGLAVGGVGMATRTSNAAQHKEYKEHANTSSGGMDRPPSHHSESAGMLQNAK
ncbi:hypothetical protein BCR44DRAFT_1445865 [Catenaria anguillulae PL171]|uniref:Uncharacterized protein n=1 Tax=Catenaria anguillulae PL171 TaxID=765915 RepID=A0A1Y2H6T3_9FUNG|nr:hypothetical protein BCR44DRAFT_1445865 [Catenaria anguillulae PL171]